MQALGLIFALIVWVAARSFSFAFILWFEAYYPAVAARVQTAYTDRGRRSVFIGLFNFIAWLLVAGLLLQTQVLALFGMAVLAALVAASIIGFAPAYRELGQRLTGHADRSEQRNVVYGFLCLEAAFLTPLVGQILLVGVLVRGLGAVISTMLASRRGEADDTPPIREDTSNSSVSSNADATT